MKPESRQSGPVHLKIDALEREARELAADLQALEPIREDAEKALALASAKDAAERFAVLAAELVEYGPRIYGQLDQVYRELLKLETLKNDMRDLAHVAGNLSPVTHPEEPVFIPPILHLVESARANVIMSNGLQAIEKAGFTVE